jgi:hypothetical protein
LTLATLNLAVLAGPVAADTPGFVFPDSCCLYEGRELRTVAPPAAAPNTGRDSLYAVPDQKAVIGAAPGDPDYHGGQWAVYSVFWNVEPYPLMSESQVLAAQARGDVDVERQPLSDFKCPVQP